MLMKLNEKQMRNAIGIAAYYCSLGVCRDWESTSPKSMIKYVPVSWMAGRGAGGRDGRAGLYRK